MTPLTLIVNPAAGRGRSRQRAAAAAAELARAGLRPAVRESESLAHGRELAAAAAAAGHVVVAVGGDGMAAALAAVASTARCRYGIIPAGRGNDLARVLQIPSDPAAAARVVAAGRTRQIDLIGVSAAGHAEALVAGSVYLGVPAVAGQIANATRWLGGPAVYPVAALRAVAGWQPARFTLSGDERVRDLPGYAVVVANSAYFGAGLQVAPPALVDDGLLDLVVLRHGPRLAFLRALATIRDGAHIALPQVELSRCAEVTVTVDRPTPAAADGETLGFADPLPSGQPLRIRVVPAALTVMVPAPAAAG